MLLEVLGKLRRQKNIDRERIDQTRFLKMIVILYEWRLLCRYFIDIDEKVTKKCNKYAVNKFQNFHIAWFIIILRCASISFYVSFFIIYIRFDICNPSETNRLFTPFYHSIVWWHEWLPLHKCIKFIFCIFTILVTAYLRIKEPRGSNFYKKKKKKRCEYWAFFILAKALIYPTIFIIHHHHYVSQQCYLHRD